MYIHVLVIFCSCTKSTAARRCDFACQVVSFKTDWDVITEQDRRAGLASGKSTEQRDVHSRNLTYQELPLEKGVSFSKPSLWVSMLVCRGVDKH